jgi:Retrotransposon hot spot protein
VESIMNKDYEKIPNSNGMKVLRNAINLETGKSIDVVIRNITEDFWQTVIDTTNRSRVCAVGTPGIGKTTSTCILIRLLLQQQKTIIYHVRTKEKNGFVYMFTRTTEGSVDVKVIQEKDFNILDENINQTSTYYIVDPGNTKDDCNPPANFIGKVIIVASPDEGHWGVSEFFKDRGSNSGGMLQFLPVWNLQELIESSSVLGTINGVSLGLTNQDIKSRFERFGGVPRYVFASKERYDVQISRQDLALQALSENDAIRLAYKDRSGIKTHSSDLPKGILLSYITNPTEKKYQNGYAVFCSDFVYDSIVKRYMSVLWGEMMRSDGSFDPYLFETYCTTLFYDRKKEKDLTFEIRENSLNSVATTKALKRCTRKEKVTSIIHSARNEEFVLFQPISTTNKFVDFVYREGRTYHFFQCTIAARHSATPKHIHQLVLDVLEMNNGDAINFQNPENTPRVHIYYTVPTFRFRKFATDPAKAKGEARSHCILNSSLWQHWDSIVSIDVLSVDRPNKEDDGVDT